jgi:hypothetical protein
MRQANSIVEVRSLEICTGNELVECREGWRGRFVYKAISASRMVIDIANAVDAVKIRVTLGS